MSFDPDDIVRAVRAGRINDFEKLVCHYQQTVWAVAVAMLWDARETEAVVQQAFVDAYLRLDQYQLGRDFGLWLKQIARNRVRQELRSRQRLTRRLELFEQHQAQVLDRERDEATETLLEKIRDCMGKLAPHAARALALRYDLAWHFDRIAAEIGRTTEATRQMLARIRVTLRECVEACARS